jgi:polyisoprenoid-binding protein YceI
MKYPHVYALFLMFVFCTSCGGQNQTDPQKEKIKSETKDKSTGYVYISKGELMIQKCQLIGGTAEVDMNTIEDKNHGSDNAMVNQLKNPDFFDVKQFPFSTIAITGVESTNNENKTVTGNLTIKGITHAVTFRAIIEVKRGIVKANGKLVIDRTN